MNLVFKWLDRLVLAWLWLMLLAIIGVSTYLACATVLFVFTHRL